MKAGLCSETGGYRIPASTAIFNGTLRLSREWLSRETAEVLWADEHQTVGLHLLPREAADAPMGSKYYDMEVKGKL